MLIMLAPMIRLMPQEIAKNGATAEKSRMTMGGLKTQYRTGWTRQDITNLAGSLGGKDAKAPSPFTEPHLALPCITIPRRAGPYLVCSLKRAAGNFLRSSVLPSATVALPCAASPRHAPPHLTGPHQNYPLKRAAEEAEASCAAVCNCSGAPPCHTQPRHTSPNLAVPARAASTLQREQQGASYEAPCCRLQL